MMSLSSKLLVNNSCTVLKAFLYYFVQVPCMVHIYNNNNNNNNFCGAITYTNRFKGAIMAVVSVVFLDITL